MAQGVNFPAHLVILKGTQIYKNGNYEEYANIEIHQMIGIFLFFCYHFFLNIIGRAGRPQFGEKIARAG